MKNKKIINDYLNTVDKVNERSNKIIDPSFLYYMHLDDCVLRSYDEEKEIQRKK